MESDVRSLVGWIRWLNERLRGEETPTKIDNADPPSFSLLVCLGLTGGRANKFPPGHPQEETSHVGVTSFSGSLEIELNVNENLY